MASTTNSQRSTAIDLDGHRFEITKSAGFEAAHRLPQDDPDHPYGRVHGHSFTVEVTLSAELSSGEHWVEDFAVLSDALTAAAGELDHTMLNDKKGLERPTLEALCVWFAGQLSPRFSTLSSVSVIRQSLNERCTLRFSQTD